MRRQQLDLHPRIGQLQIDQTDDGGNASGAHHADAAPTACTEGLRCRLRHEQMRRHHRDRSCDDPPAMQRLPP
jgi:hypothetical protein